MKSMELSVDFLPRHMPDSQSVKMLAAFLHLSLMSGNSRLFVVVAGMQPQV